MKKAILVLALTVVALAAQAVVVSADQWCAGAYDEKQGTNFGACPAQ